MKPKLIVLTPAVVVASLSLPALAEDKISYDRPAPATSAADHGKSPRQAPLTKLVKASDILGLEVRNYQDEKLGEIEDLVVDVGPERVTGLVVAVGGVLGLGDKPVIVPMSAFHYDTDKKLLHLDSTKEALKASPRFEVAKWQEFNQPEQVAEVYRYYRATPYFEETTDGAARTLPSRDKALTPLDQGNTARDLQTTAQIRKDLLSHPGLSIAARNVKIITSNGRVTLRGAVASTEELRLIQRLAEVAAPNQVDNQLVVESAVTNR